MDHQSLIASLAHPTSLISLFSPSGLAPLRESSPRDSPFVYRLIPLRLRPNHVESRFEYSNPRSNRHVSPAVYAEIAPHHRALLQSAVNRVLTERDRSPLFEIPQFQFSSLQSRSRDGRRTEDSLHPPRPTSSFDELALPTQRCVPA